MLEDEEAIVESKFSSNDRLVIPIWGFLCLFFVPATLTVVYLEYFSDMDSTTSSIIALAVMNGSINSVIAWLTIRLDGHSNDALDHLDAIMGTIEELDDSMGEHKEQRRHYKRPSPPFDLSNAASGAVAANFFA